MAGGINLVDKFVRYIDEKFYPKSQAGLVLDDKFEIIDAKTVKIMSIPNPPLNNYNCSGSNRYGTPADLNRNIQTETISQDKAFTFVVDKGDYIQSDHLMNIGTCIGSELHNVVLPEFDRYCFSKWATVAKDNGGYASTAITSSNAFSCFLDGIQYLANHKIPLKDTYAFCSYAFVYLLMQDDSFIRESNLSQEMLNLGVIGSCNGVKIVQVAADLLPQGASFLIVHKGVTVAPAQLHEAKANDDPPGISGTLVEGRFIYDCFVFDNKVHGIYYHGGQSVLKPLDIETAASAVGKTSIIIHGTKEASTNKWYAITAATHAALPAVTYGTAITPGTDAWATAVLLSAPSTEITPTSGHTRVLVVETDSSYKPLAVADTLVHVGT